MTHENFGRLFDESALVAIAPLVALTAGIILLLLLDILPRLGRARPLVFVGSIAAAYVAEVQILAGAPVRVFADSLASGPTTALWGMLFLASALIAWGFGQRYYAHERQFLIEHDVLLLSSTAGMMLMAGAQDLLVFFIESFEDARQ